MFRHRQMYLLCYAHIMPLMVIECAFCGIFIWEFLGVYLHKF